MLHYHGGYDHTDRILERLLGSELGYPRGHAGPVLSLQSLTLLKALPLPDGLVTKLLSLAGQTRVTLNQPQICFSAKPSAWTSACSGVRNPPSFPHHL